VTEEEEEILFCHNNSQ